jgi:predicted metal-dependent enzyme (double-stranded beta helix superfamily)
MVAECSALLGVDPAHAVADYVSGLLRERADEVGALLGEAVESAVLHRSDELTIVKVVMPPRYSFYPHNHLMWAAVATVVGREDNTFFVRNDAGIAPTSGAAYEAGQVGVLDAAVIHSVHNPSSAPTVGLHVYGGDLVAAPASEWDPQTGQEHPYDPDTAAARRAAWVAALTRDEPTSGRSAAQLTERPRHHPPPARGR